MAEQVSNRLRENLINFNLLPMYRLVCLCLLTPFFVHAEKDDTVKIYSFINQVIAKWSADKTFDSNFYYIVNQPDFSHFDKYLFNTDSLYLLGQTAASPIHKTDSINILDGVIKYQRFHFDEKKMNRVEIVPRKKLDKIFRKYGARGWDYLSKHTTIKSGYLTISVPIFFDNGKKAIFYYGYHCGGLCGGGKVSIYENDNGIWTERLILLKWVS